MKRGVVIHEKSPDKRWDLKISGPTQVAPHFYADFRSSQVGMNAFPFGYNTYPDKVKVRWDLPDNVCGIFIEAQCYALFRYGSRRRRRREGYRLSEAEPFTVSEIAWFCAKKHLTLKP